MVAPGWENGPLVPLHRNLHRRSALYIGNISGRPNKKYPYFVLLFQENFVPLPPKHQEQTLVRVDSPTEQ